VECEGGEEEGKEKKCWSDHGRLMRFR